MRKTLVAAVLATLALTVAGCGNGDDEKASQAISDSIMEQQKNSNSQILQVKRKDADCVGDGLVDKIGVDKLQEYGLITKDLKMDKSVDKVKMSTKDANSAADVFFDCTDVVKQMRSAMDQGGKLPPKVHDCMEKALSEKTLHEVFVATFTGKENEATTKLQTDLAACAQLGMQGTN